MTLDEILSKAVNTNPSLESMQQRISASQERTEVSAHFSNPELSYSRNTLDNSQAMSQQTVTLKQKLPFYGKRDSQYAVAQAEEDVIKENLQQAKVNLVLAIKNQAYLIWELEELHKIIAEYQDITRQNIELFESYTSTSDNQHMGIMSAELTLSDLRIQDSILKTQIYTAYTRLSYLASFEITALDIELAMWDMPDAASLKEGLSNNHQISIREKELSRQRAVAQMAELNNYPDVSLLAGYSSRENFDDYWTFGVGLSLPIYGSEDHEAEAAKKLALSAQSLKEDTKTAVDTEFQSAYMQMRSAYDIYHIIHDEALPQIEHMFELTNASISTGGDLFKYIDLLVKKLKLEQKSITAVSNYSKAEAAIEALSGEIQ
jgi:outer membrane protein TolC